MPPRPANPAAGPAAAAAAAIATAIDAATVRGGARLPANVLRADVRQILHRPIRAEPLQFGKRRAPRGHRQRLGTNELATAHVERRVADDHDFLRLQMWVEHPASAGQRGDRDVIAVFMVVRKTAHHEITPQAEPAQLDFRAQADVAREQTEHRRLRQREQVGDELPHTVTFAARALRDDVLQPENIAVEKTAKMLRPLVQVMDFEKLAHQAHIRAPGEFHLFQPVVQVEFRGEGFAKRLGARTAGVNQRAVNIE